VIPFDLISLINRPFTTSVIPVLDDNGIETTGNNPFTDRRAMVQTAVDRLNFTTMQFTAGGEFWQVEEILQNYLLLLSLPGHEPQNTAALHDSDGCCEDCCTLINSVDEFRKMKQRNYVAKFLGRIAKH
jgi:hypothetical protein